jgi:thiaminase
MNLQPLIDNLPMILAAFGLLLWAAARFTEARAKANPAHDRWDDWAPKITWASQMYSQAIDWLCSAGVLKLTGEQKLKKLNELVKAFQKAIETGEYQSAINSVVGFYVDAKGKAISANPSIGPDDPAQ